MWSSYLCLKVCVKSANYCVFFQFFRRQVWSQNQPKMKFATQSLQNPRTFLIGLYCVFLSISVSGTLIYGSYFCCDEKFDNASKTCLHFMFNSASIFSTLLTGALFYGIITKKTEFLLPWLCVELAVLTVSLLSLDISCIINLRFELNLNFWFSGYEYCSFDGFNWQLWVCMEFLRFIPL